MPVTMIHAQLPDPLHTEVNFNGSIPPGAEASMSFTSHPSEEPSTAVTRNTSTNFGIDFANDISADTSITYEGTYANTVFPTTVDYT